MTPVEELFTRKDAVEASVPVGVTAISFMGVPLETWVLVLNLAYILILIGIKLTDIYRIWRKRRGNKKRVRGLAVHSSEGPQGPPGE